MCSVAFASSTVYLFIQRPAELENLVLPGQCLDEENEDRRIDATVSTTATGVLTEEHRSESKRGAATRSDKDAGLAANDLDKPSAEEVNFAVEAGLRTEQRELLEDPNYRAARREIEKQDMWLIHREAIGALGLSANTADALMELLAEHRVQSLERPSGIPSGDDGRIDPLNPPGWLVNQRADEQRRQADIRGLLGEAKYAEWTTFRETAAARREVAFLERTFELSGDPLRSDQREALTKLITGEERRQVSEANKAQSTSIFGPQGGIEHVAMLEDNVKRIERSNERLRRIAGSYLSAQQMDLYGAALDRRLSLATAQLQVQREMIHHRSLAGEE